jgi:hypothetical protein
VHHCEERNNSIIEILGGARTWDNRFDVSENGHHTFWMGNYVIIPSLRTCGSGSYRISTNYPAGDMNYRTTYNPEMPGKKGKKKPVEDVNENNSQSPTTTEDIIVRSGDESESDSDSAIEIEQRFVPHTLFYPYCIIEIHSFTARKRWDTHTISS